MFNRQQQIGPSFQTKYYQLQKPLFC